MQHAARVSLCEATVLIARKLYYLNTVRNVQYPISAVDPAHALSFFLEFTFVTRCIYVGTKTRAGADATQLLGVVM